MWKVFGKQCKNANFGKFVRCQELRKKEKTLENYGKFLAKGEHFETRESFGENLKAENF